MGQHWLDDAEALQSIIDAAQLRPDDTIVEIGPGLGSLTKLLTQATSQVIAVEYDQDLACGLPKRVKADNLVVVSRDILQFDFNEVEPGYSVVANIPYYLTSNLIRTLSISMNPPERVTMVIQKEVAERVVAEPGEMSLLSVTAQYYWQASLGARIPAILFTPPPKVDSQILILKRRSQPLFTDIVIEDFFRLVRIGFSQRRKTLLNALSGGLHLDKAVITDLLSSVEINSGRRAQTLSLHEWHSIYMSWMAFDAKSG
jgi:16S rRNA (adenine1518-N6/adenine1519-N6)-dimethyltransferase